MDGCGVGEWGRGTGYSGLWHVVLFNGKFFRIAIFCY